MTTIKFKNAIVNVCLDNQLHISYDGEVLLDKYICDDVSYSHFEIRKDYLIIYFKGKRDYVVIIKNNELKIASFYDEINILEGELIFMCKCYDCLQHGKVFLINKNNEYDSYLVYLNQIEISNEMFIGFSMLDSIMVGNTKYANNLLTQDIRLEDDTGLVSFFPEFDDYICLEINTYALIEKNTLAGIYKLDIENNRISNIIQMN